MSDNFLSWVDIFHISAQDWLQTIHQYFEHKFPITWHSFVAFLALFVGICEKLLRRGHKKSKYHDDFKALPFDRFKRYHNNFFWSCLSIMSTSCEMIVYAFCQLLSK